MTLVSFRRSFFSFQLAKNLSNIPSQLNDRMQCLLILLNMKLIWKILGLNYTQAGLSFWYVCSSPSVVFLLMSPRNINSKEQLKRGLGLKRTLLFLLRRRHFQFHSHTRLHHLITRHILLWPAFKHTISLLRWIPLRNSNNWLASTSIQRFDNELWIEYKCCLLTAWTLKQRFLGDSSSTSNEWVAIVLTLGEWLPVY